MDNIEIYLDNSATTKVCEKSADKILEMMVKKYGNPSSFHSKGFEAEKEIDKAREIISSELGCDRKEIYFTSGGTEANNLAVFGAVKSKKRLGNKIITTAIEHSSVLESMQELQRQGFDVIFLNPDENGVVSEEKILDAIDEKTILVSIMLVNNEVGSRQPVEFIRNAVKIKKSPALIHIDAVQAFCKIPVKVSRLKADLVTITAHKVHGPKGVGALYVSDKIKLKPIIFGGEQQNKLRPGTESAPLIVGFGEAVKENNNNLDYISDLRDYCILKLSEINKLHINSPKNSIGIVNFSVFGIRSETMLHFLSLKNIFVSSGSACAKNKKSYVLKSMKLDKDCIDSAIRVSFSKYNSKDDIDKFVFYLKEGIKSLVKKS